MADSVPYIESSLFTDASKSTELRKEGPTKGALVSYVVKYNGDDLFTVALVTGATTTLLQFKHDDVDNVNKQLGEISRLKGASVAFQETTTKLKANPVMKLGAKWEDFDGTTRLEPTSTNSFAVEVVLRNFNLSKMTTISFSPLDQTRAVPTAPIMNLVSVARTDADIGKAIVDIISVLHGSRPSIETMFKKLTKQSVTSTDAKVILCASMTTGGLVVPDTGTHVHPSTSTCAGGATASSSDCTTLEPTEE